MKPSDLSLWQILFTQHKFSAMWSLFFGALVPLSFAPFNTISSFFSYLIFIPLALFFQQLLWTETLKQAFYRGLVFGVGLFSVGVSWLYVAIHDFGGAHWTLAAFFTGIFILFLSLFYASFAWFVVWLKNKKIVSLKILGLLYIPVFWLFFEWLRSWILTGFPWIIVGYPMIETPISAYAPVFGIYGLSYLVIVISSLLIAPLKPYIRMLSIAAIFIVGLLLAQIQWSEKEGSPLSVTLIQGNVNQSVKWDRIQLEKTKQLYTRLSREQWSKSDLIVWPENAIPTFYHDLKYTFYRQLTDMARTSNTELITGLPFYDEKKQKYYNASMNFGGSQSGVYYKTHLVPFGEYVPFASLIRNIMQLFNMPMSSFSVGDSKQKPLIIKDYPVVMTLCYEDIFAQDIISHIPEAKFMINLSNNGWYGDSFAPHQHLEMARMRALETSREIIRSTTSGISALIDAQGQIKVQGPQFETAVIKGSIQPRSGITLYVFWGNYPLLAFMFIVLFILFWRINFSPMKKVNLT